MKRLIRKANDFNNAVEKIKNLLHRLETSKIYEPASYIKDLREIIDLLRPSFRFKKYLENQLDSLLGSFEIDSEQEFDEHMSTFSLGFSKSSLEGILRILNDSDRKSIDELLNDPVNNYHDIIEYFSEINRPNKYKKLVDALNSSNSETVAKFLDQCLHSISMTQVLVQQGLIITPQILNGLTSNSLELLQDVFRDDILKIRQYLSKDVLSAIAKSLIKDPPFYLTYAGDVERSLNEIVDVWIHLQDESDKDKFFERITEFTHIDTYKEALKALQTRYRGRKDIEDLKLKLKQKLSWR